MPEKQIDLTGQQIGKVVVVSFKGKRRRPSGSFSYEWLCRCECGKEFVVDGACIRRGSTKSCGCTRNSEHITHGMTKHRLYSVYYGMLGRCYNPRNKSYPYYGGRGIRVCKRWRQSFISFVEDMGRKPSPNATIDRIDNNGNYEPQNCRWATRAEQNENTRQTKLVTINGETLSLRKWYRRLAINRSSVQRRASAHGISTQDALLQEYKSRQGSPEVYDDPVKSLEAKERRDAARRRR